MIFAWKQHWRCEKVLPCWNSDHQPPITLHNWAIEPPAYSLKILRSFANHLYHEYRERTTPPRICVPCNLSSCRLHHVIKLWNCVCQNAQKLCLTFYYLCLLIVIFKLNFLRFQILFLHNFLLVSMSFSQDTLIDD